MIPKSNLFVVFFLYLKKNRRKVLKAFLCIFLALIVLSWAVSFSFQVNLWLKVKRFNPAVNVVPILKTYFRQSVDIGYSYRIPKRWLRPQLLTCDTWKFKEALPEVNLLSMEGATPIAFPLKMEKGRLPSREIPSVLMEKSIIHNLVRARVALLKGIRKEAEDSLIANIPIFYVAFLKGYNVLRKNGDELYNFCLGRYTGVGENPYCFLNPEPSRILLLYRMEMHSWFLLALSYKDSRISVLRKRGIFRMLENSVDIFNFKSERLYLYGISRLFSKFWRINRIIFPRKTFVIYSNFLLGRIFPLKYDFSLEHLGLSGKFRYFDTIAIKNSYMFYLPTIVAIKEAREKFRGRKVKTEEGPSIVEYDGGAFRISYTSPNFPSSIYVLSGQSPEYYDSSLDFLVSYWNLKKNPVSY